MQKSVKTDSCNWVAFFLPYLCTRNQKKTGISDKTNNNKRIWHIITITNTSMTAAHMNITSMVVAALITITNTSTSKTAAHTNITSTVAAALITIMSTEV